MREKIIVQKILQYLNGLDHCYARKIFSSNFTANLPDIIACYRGRTLALEVKRPGNSLTKLQEIELLHWTQADAIATRVDCVDDVRLIIASIDSFMTVV